MAAAGSMPRPSDIIAGSYRVERTIGTGGMGHVVAATDLRTNAPVAIKLLSVKDDEVAVQRFFREARSSMNIRCDHVVRVLEVGSVHGAQPFMVMERLSGQDLAVCVRGQKTLPVQQVVDIAVDTCDALAHAHAAGIVHRDIKLSNLFYCEPDKHIKVLDFGISKSEDREVWERTLTRTGADSVLGSPPFMSPEQIRTPKTVDGRTDIWALGVVLYRLLSGRMPFDGDTVGELFAAILERDPPPLTTMAPHVSPAIAQVVHKCLLRDRKQRYGNVGQIARDLAPFTTHKPVADSAMLVQPPGASLETVGTLSIDGSMNALMGTTGAVPANGPHASAFPAAVSSVSSVSSVSVTPNGGTPLPFSQPPPRPSVPSAPQIAQRASNPSVPPYAFTPTGGYTPPQPSGYPPPPPSHPSSSMMGASGMFAQTGSQPMWTGSGVGPMPEGFTTSGFSSQVQPRRWPWIVLSFAALGLAIVLAWGAAGTGGQQGTANAAHEGSARATTSATPPASVIPASASVQPSLVPSASSSTPATSASAPSSAVAPPKRRVPGGSQSAQPRRGGLHDSPYGETP